jgi:TldD protein
VSRRGQLFLKAGSVLLFASAPLAGSVQPASASSAAPADSEEPLVRAMRDELARSMQQLKLPDAAAPYYIAFRVDEQTNLTASASFGALTSKQTSRGRSFRADVRVGDYALDNSNTGGRYDFNTTGFERLPIEDDYDAIRHDIWYGSDQTYKQAAAEYAKKIASRKTQNQSSDEVGDFSREKPSRIVGRRATEAPDSEQVVGLVKQLSALAKNFPEIQGSEVKLAVTSERRVVLTSEGTFTDGTHETVTLNATLRTQADDGMPLTRMVSFSATSLEALPSREVLVEAIKRAGGELSELRHAREADDYTGPVLFEGPAAAQLVREMLGPNFSGAPAPKSDAMGSMARAMGGKETEWAGKVGQRVVATGLGVMDDPTVDHIGSLNLLGQYAADDEGMPAERVSLVEKGILKRFLMSRAPRKGFEHSNGHARSSFFASAKASISNLVVTADKGLNAADLRKKLLAEATSAKLPYAIVVRELDDAVSSGDYSAILRRAQGANVSPPTVVLQVTADGKEQPWRGATFASFPLQAFEEIVAAGNEPAVTSWAVGTAGSVVSPALLFKRVEIKKPTGPQRKLPLLPHPFFAEKGSNR